MTRPVVLAAALLLAAAPALAQPAPPPAAAASWRDRVAVAVRAGQLQPTGRSELYALLDRALDPGARALRPTLVSGALHLRLDARWGLVLGAEAGGRTLGSESRVRPDAEAAAVAQRTTLELSSQQLLGIEGRVYPWRATPAAAARPQLRLGAGVGTARYRLRQWGRFVDVERGLAFDDDLRSGGRGTVGYATAALAVPLGRGVALEWELRRQAGSAPMTADYATFDRLDLGGTRVSAGLRVEAGRR